MKKNAIILITIVFITFLVGYIFRLRQENKRLEEINSLLVQINETQRQKQTLMESVASDPVLFKSLERAMTDFDQVIRKLAQYRITGYNSSPNGESVVKLEHIKTLKKFEIRLSSNQAPPDLFRPPTNRK